jgi:glycosyltransferase involved in cell wall biosynthesis
MKVSVVISAFNEEKKIEDCLKSIRGIASEIIFIDNSSTDKTVSIAKKYTDSIFIRENNPMLNVNKNYGFSKVSGDWILNLDADERVTETLFNEIESIDKDTEVSGFLIPRKNIIFGRWIQHTGWYPDYVLRLFRKDKGKFEEKHVHEQIKIEGKIEKLENPFEHLNYESISQFLNKMVKTYTVSEAENLLKTGYQYNSFDIARMPLSEFIKRYFAEEGFKDGMHGLVLSLLQAFYHFIVFLRLWEAHKYPDEKDIDALFKNGKKTIGKEVKYWMYKNKIDNERNIIRKQTLKLKRKILS